MRVKIEITDITLNKLGLGSPKQLIHLECEVENSQDLIDAVFAHLGKGYNETIY